MCIKYNNTELFKNNNTELFKKLENHLKLLNNYKINKQFNITTLIFNKNDNNA